MSQIIGFHCAPSFVEIEGEKNAVGEALNKVRRLREKKLELNPFHCKRLLLKAMIRLAMVT